MVHLRVEDFLELFTTIMVAYIFVLIQIRYRAAAHVCNACSIKHLCTESEEGREIEHNPDSWLESEIARFHRGISLALLFLAGLLLVVEMIRHQRPMELLILSGFLVPIALLGSQLSSAYFAPRR